MKEVFDYKENKHWAAQLETGDRCKATLRHKTDGSLNKHNVPCIVIEVDDWNSTITASTEYGIRTIPFCELKPADSLTPQTDKG